MAEDLPSEPVDEWDLDRAAEPLRTEGLEDDLEEVLLLSKERLEDNSPRTLDT